MRAGFVLAVLLLCSTIFQNSPELTDIVYAAGEGEVYVLNKMWGTKGRGDREIYNAAGLAADDAGNLYVTDFVVSWDYQSIADMRVHKFSSNGTYLLKFGSKCPSITQRKFGCTELGDGQFDLIGGVAVDPAGNAYVGDIGAFRIQRFTSGGRFLSKFEIAQPSCQAPWGFHTVAVDRSFNVYTVLQCATQPALGPPSPVSEKILKFSQYGALNDSFEVLRFMPEQKANAINHIAVDSLGNIYATTSAYVVKFSARGELLQTWGGKGSGDGEFSRAGGIAIDRSDFVYVVDSPQGVNQENARVQKFTNDGRFLSRLGKPSALPGEGGFYGPYYAAVDLAGNIYVTESGGLTSRIQKWSPLSSFDFEISISSTSLRVAPGKTVNVSIMVKSTSDLKQEVTLKATNVPAVMKTLFVPVKAKAPYTSTLFISIPVNATLGGTDLTITATGGIKTQRTLVSLKPFDVTSPPDRKPAIPGFQIESILLGLISGVIILLIRRPRRTIVSGNQYELKAMENVGWSRRP